MLNAHWLETFIVLTETGHFTKTAEIRGMTQPGVSQHLSKLENQLGHALISRDGKKFTLTPAGEAVVIVGKARRDQEKDLLQTIRHDDPGIGRVSLGTAGGFATLLYPTLFDMMMASPDLNICLEAAPQDSVLKGVKDGRFDLGIIDHEPRDPRLEAEYLGQEELCLVLPKNALRAPITFSSLQKLGLVAHPDVNQYADELFSKNFGSMFKGAEQLRVRTSVNQINQIPAPVENGLGYTLLPRSGIDAYPNRENLEIMTLPDPVFHSLWLVFRRGRVLPARVRRVSEQIRLTSSALETR
ncbi:LysR family transcriptional regulator [Algimonas arctica]|uniref:LysR family transcriptional regulator n=1 Tax=Algimonas arctica TaxID=1479486 RepID=A0A8J3G280_9PROT|nr:LysR family transcriptional regulator [Algimonas arctica]GHA93261.1 LysR family transcriptional regulator [Algimonas arctica]